MRHAFAKICPKHDYEPRNWDGKQMELFGVWDVGLSRITYNRQYGVTNIGSVATPRASTSGRSRTQDEDQGKTRSP